MIFTELQAIAYRDHDPKWAFLPTGGAGVHGGRANRPGLNAFDLSLDIEDRIAFITLIPPSIDDISGSYPNSAAR